MNHPPNNCARSIALLVSCFCLSVPAIAGTWCDSYWPLNSGDYKTFRYGTKTLSVSVYSYLGNEYQLNVSTDQDSGYELHERTPNGIYLSKVSANGGWIKVYLDPAVLLFDDALLQNGGSRVTKTRASQSGTSYSATFTVKVSKAGKVTVPAGTFLDCRSVTVSETANVPGQGTVTATMMTAVLAPRVGMIKKLVKPGVWSVLDSGMVGGSDVKDLAGVVASTLQMQVNGAGTVSPDYSGKTLAVGKSYTITAVPAKGYVFSHWAGSLSSTTPKLSFVMQKDMELQAYFVPNPFIPVKGNFTGLVAEPGMMSQRSAGFLTVSVTDKGHYSGRLLLAGRSYAISGQFDTSGISTVTPKGSDLTVQLQLDLGSGTDRIAGTVSSAGWTAQVDGDRAVFNARTNPAGAAGRYTLVIPGSSIPSVQPGGYSYGTVTVDQAGRARFAGSLADGTKVTQTAVLSKNGEWPLFVTLNKGQGVLVSWVSFASTPAEDLSGEGAWIRPAVAGAKYYPGGFSMNITLTGSRYAVPSPGSNPIGLTDARAAFSDGDLPDTISQVLTLDASGKVTNLKSKEFRLKFTRASGLFTGRMVNALSPGPISFKGVVLQKQKVGCGYFPGSEQTGALWIGSAQ